MCCKNNNSCIVMANKVLVVPIHVLKIHKKEFYDFIYI